MKEEWEKELQVIETNDYGLLIIKLQHQHINQNYGLVNKEDSNVEQLRTINLSDNLIDKYLQKSSELSRRAKFKEKNMSRFANHTVGAYTEEEVGDLLIDSILYKVNVLQNM